MTLEIENLSELDRKVVISINVENFNNKIKEQLLEQQKKTKLAGFRPGKVPLKMIEDMYGASLKDKLLNDLASEEFYNFVVDNKVNIAGLQKLDLVENQSDDKEIKINAFFDVYPDDINIPDFKSLELEKVIAKVKDEDINDTIEMLKKQKATFELSKEKVKNGDRVTVDFEGFIDKKSFKGSNTKDYVVILGNGQLLPDFESNIIGMKIGDSKDVNFKFPDNYQEKDLAGKDAVFKITLKKVDKIKLPEMDELFIKSLGIKDGKIETLKKEISKNLNREINFRSYSITKQKILDKLLESTNIKVPNSLIAREVDKLKHQALKNLEKQGLNKDELKNINDDLFKDKAKKSVGLGIIVNKIIKTNNLKATDAQVKEVISVFAENYEDPQGYINWYLKDKNNLENAKALALENNVIDLILSKAKVKEKNYSFKEIMQL